MEKERTSGEIERPEASAPMLPTVNPATEKPAAKTGLHPAIYIAYALPPCAKAFKALFADQNQHVDRIQFQRYSLQQMDSRHCQVP